MLRVYTITDHNSCRTCNGSESIHTPAIDGGRGGPVFNLGEHAHLDFVLVSTA
jgi:hypothetical protein